LTLNLARGMMFAVRFFVRLSNNLNGSFEVCKRFLELKPMILKLCAASAWAAATILATPALGQTFPQRQVTMVVPYTAGGVADSQARILARQLERRWKQPIVIENKSGSVTVLGTASVAKAAPDCHTLLLAGLTVPLNALVVPNLPYNTERDLAPVSHITSVPNLLVVPASSKFTTLKDLIEYARQNPGKLTFASTGIGGTSHLASELLASSAHIDIDHIPYRGGSAAVPDLLTDRVNMMFDSSSAENVASGALRALAISTQERSELFPTIPTVAEQGFPNFEATAWFAIWTTGGSPPACIEKISADINETLKDRELQSQFAKLGAMKVGTTPQQTAAFLQSEASRWGNLIRERGLKLN
jgi:tripartite-type tricarboxylate transporter receptor subunit TctC